MGDACLGARWRGEGGGSEGLVVRVVAEGDPRPRKSLVWDVDRSYREDLRTVVVVAFAAGRDGDSRYKQSTRNDEIKKSVLNSSG